MGEGSAWTEQYSHVNVDWAMKALVSGSHTAEHTVLALHGYQQTGASILRRLEPVLSGAHVIAVNGPFLIPFERRGDWQEGYAWYFFDLKRQAFLVPMEVAIGALGQALAKWGLRDKVDTIIGYSQGGYLAPFLARTLPAVRQVIGVSCRFREEDLGPSVLPFRLDAIHGRDDELVDAERSRACHEQLLRRGQTGDFHTLEGIGHRWQSAMGDKVAEILWWKA